MNIGLEIKKNNSAGHKFIQTTGKPISGAITEASVLLANQYLKQKLSAKSWRKEKRTWNVNFEFPPGQKKVSKPINYLTISEYIRLNGRFDTAQFNLPELECMWLDHATEMKLDFHIHDHTGTFGIASGDLQTHYYGKSYPINPLLKREGHLYTSFQPQLIARIVNDRQKLILNSDMSLTDDWVFDLRNLVSNTISLLDIAFTQLYIKAEYDPLPGWTFDKTKLGERHGKRLNDKFKWVYQITGNALNIEAEKESVENLRVLRNHLMHFDPPSLVITLEEVALWLNQIVDIGRILIKFRQALNVDISVGIINFLLQEEAVFVPFSKGKRQPLNSKGKEDYYSSTWP
ncbi:MAG: hypothetical protein JNL72_08860 [Flavipsychrobacter sp.]|nr:hypothetical protein [Flavipsychrobacter sp.]